MKIDERGNGTILNINYMSLADIALGSLLWDKYVVCNSDAVIKSQGYMWYLWDVLPLRI